MGKQGDCITIVRKDGHRAVVPLSIWENHLKNDKDWKIESRPILDTPEMKMVKVLVEKPKAPEPEPVVVPVEPPKVQVVEELPKAEPVVEPKVEKPKPKRKYTRRQKKP